MTSLIMMLNRPIKKVIINHKPGVRIMENTGVF